jgi:nucleolar protein 14
MRRISTNIRQHLESNCFCFQRKKTLFQEYRIKDKSNKFLDRRIGEKNSAMTTEDKIMARFTAERMKMHNKVILCM